MYSPTSRIYPRVNISLRLPPHLEPNGTRATTICLRPLLCKLVITIHCLPPYLHGAQVTITLAPSLSTRSGVSVPRPTSVHRRLQLYCNSVHDVLPRKWDNIMVTKWKESRMIILCQRMQIPDYGVTVITITIINCFIVN